MAAPQLVFIGAGRMAAAMIRGLIAQQIYRPEQIGCLSKSGDTARKLAAETGITPGTDLASLLAEADTVVIAFKPQSLATADPRLAELTSGKLVLSVLAGKKLARLAEFFPHARSLVRTMPNTPAAIGAGITPYCSLAPLLTADPDGVLGAGERLEGVVANFWVKAAPAIFDVDEHEAAFLSFIDVLGADRDVAFVVGFVAVTFPSVDQ
jgi:pyrroline-5-carboxylate reductase